MKKTSNPTTFLNSEKWTVGWGFTTRCDLKCPFCYSSKVRQNSQFKELDITQVEQFLERNGKHIYAINFGTGEFFLSPTFPLVLKSCERYAPHAKAAVTTNGAFADLSPDSLPIVKKYIDECDISIDFAQPDKHDLWRKKSGAWNRAVRAIELAKEFDFDTSIVMIGTAQTLTEENIRGMLDMSENHQVAIRINIYMPTFGDYSFIPSLESVFLALEMLVDWGDTVCSSDKLIGSIIDNSEVDLYTKQSRSCRILPDGSISPSTYLINFPWIINSSLSDIMLTNLSDTESFRRYRYPPTPKACEGCSILEKCKGGSIERRLLWTRSLESPDPLCPMINNYYKKLPVLSEEKKTKKWLGPSIHLGYLPTIVAIPPTL